MIDDSFFPIIGWENRYEINKKGDIKSIKRNKIMRVFTCKGGYRHIMLEGDGRKSRYLIQRLMAATFLNKNFINKWDKTFTVFKIDGNPSNDSLDNIKIIKQNEWEQRKVLSTLDNLTFESVKQCALHYGITATYIIKNCKRYKDISNPRFSYVE